MQELIASNTIAKFSLFTHQEIVENISRSYTNGLESWRIGEPPLVEHPYSIVLNTIPNEVLKRISIHLKSSPHLLWDTESIFLPDRLIILKIKLKEFFETTQQIENEYLFEKSRTDEEYKAYIKKLAFFDYVLKFMDSKTYTQSEIFESIVSVGIEYYINYKSFNLFLKNFKDHREVSLVHRLKGKPGKQSWGENHVAKIGHLLGQGLFTSDIYLTLKSYCEKNGLVVISESTIKRIIKKKNLRAIYSIERHGEAHAKQHIGGYIEREKPQYKLQVVEADGSRLQLPYLVSDSSKWKIRFLTLYVIIDVASNCVVGYSIDDYENKEMVLLAFYMMLKKYNHIPAFVRIDKSKPHQSNRFKRFRDLCELKGSEFKYCLYPREKGTVENFYLWFPEKICKRFSCYNGLSLVSSKWYHQPNYEEVERRLKSEKHIPTRTQLIQTIPDLINMWNHREIVEHQFIPSIKIEQLLFKNAIYSNFQTSAFLTWKIKEKENFSRNTIAFRDETGNRRAYYLSDNDLAINLYSSNYKIAWLDSEYDYVHVFDDEDKYIGQASKKGKYLDDPLNIDPIEEKKMFGERNHNNALLQRIKEKVDTINKQLEMDSKDLVEYNISSRLLSDKRMVSESEDDFVNKHFDNQLKEVKPSRRRKKEKVQFDTDELDKNFTSIRFRNKSQNGI